MKPDDPASDTGSHFIFIHEADLQAAIDGFNRVSLSPRGAAPAVSDEDERGGDIQAPPQALVVGRASDGAQHQVRDLLVGELGPDELPVIGTAEFIMLSGAVRRLEARKHYPERVAGWKGSRKGPTEADELIWFKTNFGIGRADARKIRGDLAPQEWKQTGGKNDR